MSISEVVRTEAGFLSAAPLVVPRLCAQVVMSRQPALLCHERVIDIGPLTASDRAGWESLFRDYIAFYGRTVSESMYEHAWRRFQQGADVHAFDALLDGALVGIAHFLSHPNTSAPGADSCY